MTENTEHVTYMPAEQFDELVRTLDEPDEITWRVVSGCPDCGGELLTDDELCQFCRSNAVHREWYPELYGDALKASEPDLT